MKKIILLALAALMMVGCGKRKYEIESHSGIVIKDSCEYLLTTIAIDKHVYLVMPHKGNCRFCKERDSIKWEKRKKELGELIEQLKEK